MRPTLLALIAMIMLIGCGKRGALYLPDSPPQAESAQAADQTVERP